MESELVERSGDQSDGPHETGLEAEIRGHFSLDQLAELAGTPRRRIVSWIRAGLISRSPHACDQVDAFGFRHVLAAVLLAKLTEKRYRTASLRRILECLARRFPDPHERFANLDLPGALPALREDGRLTAPDGQLLLDFVAEPEIAPSIALRCVSSGGPRDLFERAVSLERDGDLEGAVRAYHDCLLQSGPDATACFNLANVLAALDRTEAAVERYRQTLELDPHHAAAWNNLGLAFAERGELDAALDAWHRAVELAPELFDAIFNLADALQQAGRFDEAHPFWELYLRHDTASKWGEYARSCLETAIA